MIRNYNRYKFWQLLLAACVMLLTTSCRETIEQLFSDGIEAGDEVAFTASVQERTVKTRAAETQEDAPRYRFTIGMYEMVDKVETKVGDDGIYTVEKKGGALLADTKLYWPSNVVPYLFKAVAGSSTLSGIQDTPTKWLSQDRLTGGTDVYRSAKGWKQYNMQNKNADLTTVPLNMQHTRSLITVILKAGEGVSRQALAYNVAENDLSATIYSYTDKNGNAVPLEIKPLASEKKVDYIADKNGGAETGVSSTRYDAIVEPWNYADKPDDYLLVRINLSGQKYSFYARNDDNLAANKENYQLQAGQNLIITVTLSRDQRKTKMTAYIEDWTEDVTTTICDDYGNAGEPIEIKTREDLKNFLADKKVNKPGNVGLVLNDIDLGDWSGISYDLKCTLNLGGWKLTSNHRLLNNIDEAAHLQNGTIEINGVVDAAVATKNSGSIEDVKVTAATTEAHATKAGVVEDNAGVISKCQSALAVTGGTSGYVGGIAATSLIANGENLDCGTVMIDGCTVTNRVADGGKGGGIVGHADGTVTNNTFEYGITIGQNKTTHKNIVGLVGNGAHQFANNAWPTIDDSPEMVNMIKENLYTGIIDSQAELKQSTTTDYNKTGYRYRLAKNFEVSEPVGDVAYKLDGNKKQLSVTNRVFGTITGSVYDLKVHVTKSLIAKNIEADRDYMAPVAYAVAGPDAELRNIKVTMADGAYIQASNPAGLVVWAGAGATVSGCEVTADIRAWVSEPKSSNERKCAGGIVALGSKATISKCVFHTGSKLNAQFTDATVIYYGGIVGGVARYNSENPELTITDCTSYCTSYITTPEDDYHGGILGYAMKEDKSNGTKDCQGNWWPNKSDGKASKGVAAWQSGVTADATIGKRNAVKPAE